ncbi:MAG: class I SAM-dependent methyltransferase [Nocardioides sp.]
MSMVDPARVAAQYASESRLDTRRSVWRESDDGRSPVESAARAIREAQPTSVLEVGCGGGQFAARLAAENPQARVVATDLSPRMAELAASRGVEAHVADVAALPFGDGTFDVVAALWMLYHVPDLDAGLSELRRVLRPGGLLVAVTNGDEHTADLRREAGGAPMVTAFSSENGEPALRRHFAEVAREDIATQAVFDDHAAAASYLASFDEGLAAALPWFEGPRTYAGAATVFTAR